jgi:probable HAF family extracellular repeat protein
MLNEACALHWGYVGGQLDAWRVHRSFPESPSMGTRRWMTRAISRKADISAPLPIECPLSSSHDASPITGSIDHRGTSYFARSQNPGKETRMRVSVIGRSGLATFAIVLAASSCRSDLPTSPVNGDDIAFARQTASYSSSIIALLPGDASNRANGVNDAGEIVGYSQGSAGLRAFVTIGGVVTQLGQTTGNAHAISNGATRYVVGQSGSSPARWTIIGNSPGSSELLDQGGATSGAARGVNDAGAAAGNVGISGAVWDAAGILSLVSTPTGFTKGEGRDIDNAGNSVFVFTRPEAPWEGGFAAAYVRFANGQLVALPPLSGDVVTYANGLGPAGGNLVLVAGSSYSAPSRSRAVRWTVDVSTGAVTNIEARPESSHALALADDGATAGFTEGPTSSLKTSAFRWQGTTLLSLNPPGEAMLQGRRAAAWTFPAP